MSRTRTGKEGNDVPQRRQQEANTLLSLSLSLSLCMYTDRQRKGQEKKIEAMFGGCEKKRKGRI